MLLGEVDRGREEFSNSVPFVSFEERKKSWKKGWIEKGRSSKAEIFSAAFHPSPASDGEENRPILRFPADPCVVSPIENQG